MSDNPLNLKPGDKVYFNYYDHDKCKDVSGRGKVTDVDTDNDQLLVQTTRGLHWMQIEAAKPINPIHNDQ